VFGLIAHSQDEASAAAAAAAAAALAVLARRACSAKTLVRLASVGRRVTSSALVAALQMVSRLSAISLSKALRAVGRAEAADADADAAAESSSSKRSAAHASAHLQHRVARIVALLEPVSLPSLSTKPAACAAMAMAMLPAVPKSGLNAGLPLMLCVLLPTRANMMEPTARRAALKTGAGTLITLAWLKMMLRTCVVHGDGRRARMQMGGAWWHTR